MNMAKGFGDERREHRPDDGGAIPRAIGGDERRMHVRAYNHWISLLKGRAFPSIADLDPANLGDFAANSVLLDFSRGLDAPVLSYLGAALRDECGIAAHVIEVADVPARSLLSRLTDHYPQIIANRAPIGFEAEFAGTRGATTLYRGILMPFASADGDIDFVYGVINWKVVAPEAIQAALTAELARAVRTAPSVVDLAPIWADGPGAREGTAPPAVVVEHVAPDAAEALRMAAARPAIATLSLATGTGPGELVVLVARGTAEGGLEIVGAVTDAPVVTAASRALC